MKTCPLCKKRVGEGAHTCVPKRRKKPCPGCGARDGNHPFNCSVHPFAQHEARASVSLDGQTQSCEACLVEDWLAKDVSDFKSKRSTDGKERVFDSALVWFSRPAHTCGKRAMTAAERELVEACVRGLDQRGNIAARNIRVRADAVRAERKKETK